MTSEKIFTHPLFALGFRAFFVLAGFSALVLIVVWNAMFKGQLPMDNYYHGTFWHAHEMLLGYTGAVIAGFLLTAVKNWTGRATVSGGPLFALCMLWLYGRVLPFYSGVLPDSLIALVDFAFLPTLVYQLSKPIIQAQHYNGLVFLGLLLILVLGNGLIHAELLQISASTAWQGIQMVVATLITLILVIAGRIFPFFTERGLTGTLIIRNPLWDQLAIASALVFFGLYVTGVTGVLLALGAIVAGVVNAIRVGNWYVQKIWYVPLLWVLYTGYGWIILGFFLSAFSAYQTVQTSVALHAFTVGGIGVLTLGMMARVSLGHTGRALRVSNTMALGFVLINLAVLFRVLLPAAMPAWYNNLIYISTLLWLAAFSLFVFTYLPILIAPRVDGQDG